jgi:mannose-6-phosphate isomerase-like protein (cupin superfamily)
MSQTARELFNPRTGQRMKFLLTAADTDGELLRIETLNAPNGVAEPIHVHPFQESRAEVRAGTLRFLVDGITRRLESGETITIPAGVPHRFANDGDEDAVAIQELRPALRTAEFFQTYFDLAARGELDQHGKPSLLRSALLGPKFAAEIRLVSPRGRSSAPHTRSWRRSRAFVATRHRSDCHANRHGAEGLKRARSFLSRRPHAPLR